MRCIIDFLLREGFHCLDAGKLSHFYSYQYSDKFSSIHQIYFFFVEKKSIEFGHLAVMSEKNDKTDFITLLNQIRNLSLLLFQLF